MTRWLLRLSVQGLALVWLISTVGVAQAQDRSQMEKDIEVLREQLSQKEREFLAPSSGDRAAFAEFLLQPDTGLARLLPREKYREKLNIREGGAYYSFTKLSNNYDDDPQIGLERDSINTGFAGADFGFLVSLGDIPLESIGLDNECVQYLAAFTPPNALPEAREQQQKSSSGFVVGRNRYTNRLPVTVGGSYVLRSISYRESDVLIAFRIVRRDTDGSLILLWKKLRQFSVPYLARP